MFFCTWFSLRSYLKRCRVRRLKSALDFPYGRSEHESCLNPSINFFFLDARTSSDLRTSVQRHLMPFPEFPLSLIGQDKPSRHLKPKSNKRAKFEILALTLLVFDNEHFTILCENFEVSCDRQHTKAINRRKNDLVGCVGRI